MDPSPDTQELLQQAASAGASGDLRQAERCCREVLAVDSRNADALQLMGMVRWRSGDVDEGERLLRESLAIMPEQPHVLANIGNLLVSKQDHESALTFYTESVRLAPDFADAWLHLGIAQGETGNIPAAIDALQRTLDLRPRDLQALYAMARAHTENADHENAIDSYRKALGIDSNIPELHQCYGDASYELGRVDDALSSYRQALTLDAEALEVHETLNWILWQHGMRDDHLGSYPPAIQTAPRSLPLRLQYAGSLSRVGRHHEAEEVLREASKMFGPEAGIHSGLGRSLVNQGRIAEAIEHFTAAVGLAPQDVRGRQDLARILISSGSYSEALRHIDAATELAPLDQAIIAYRGLVWHLSGDPRESRLNDYDSFIKSYAIPVPEGYRDIHEFNRALNRALDPLHGTKVHPLDQTLRGGTQTHGSLFAHRIREVQEVRDSIERSVREYIEEMDDDSDHPFLGRKCERFRFSASWSCRLGQQGFHTNHVHPKGWISSSYYVSLPEAVGKGDSHEGWIKFGETNLGLGSLEHIGKLVQPTEGLLVLFPSYMFHGTIPFSSEEARTTIAFDVVPE